MAMPRFVRYTSLLVLPALIGLASAQTGPQFDVASVKPNQTPPGRGLAALREDINTTPGNLTMRNVTLATSIRWAYNLNTYQVSGPDSISSDRFDIIAKAGSPAPESQLRLMLQALLADRFKLTFHRQMKELSAYVLVPGKGPGKGPNKLQVVEGEAGGEGSMVGGGLIFEGHQMPMSRLADILSGIMRAPVLDMTGLDGHYDFKVDMRPYITPPQPGEPPLDLQGIAIVALQAELGLKLESRKANLEVFEVDHAEKTPSEN
jgi:uncharacterized protein (TIGR03435 family)